MTMRQVSIALAVSIAVLLPAGLTRAAGVPGGPLTTCPIDAVVSGTTCMDKYEASVWRVPSSTTQNAQLVAKIRSGTATTADLITGGARQLGTVNDNYAPCADNGANCANDIYAVSLPGLMPSVFITWFQAQQACTNAGKRLPSNAEWQAAVVGTPDPGPDNGTTDCNTKTANKVIPAGSRSGCVSSRGAFDMVGNVSEWVADWTPRSTLCGHWSASVSSDDAQCLAGVADTGLGEPTVLTRGGNFFYGPSAGPLTLVGFNPLNSTLNDIGFRCAR